MSDHQDLGENVAPPGAEGISLEASAAATEAEAFAPAEADHAPIAPEVAAPEARRPIRGGALTPSLLVDGAPEIEPPADGRIYELVPAPFERIGHTGGAAAAGSSPSVLGSVFRIRNIAAAAAAFAILAAIGAELLTERHRQAALLAQRNQETEALAQTVKTLKARLDTIESAKSREDTAELRRTIGELKSGVASARDLNGAFAQLAQRVEKIDHEQNTKVEKLGEKVDKETAAKAAELAARIDKLEKKTTAPVVAAAQPAPPPTPTPPARQVVDAPKAPPPVSMETTGSIERPKPMIRGYAVLDADGESAMVAGRDGPFEVHVGEVLPGAGRIERIERRGRAWAVVTNLGVITAAD